MENHLQQQVAEFVLQLAHVGALDRLGDFIGLLDRVAGDRGEILFEVPGAAAIGVAQPRHDPEKPVDGARAQDTVS